MASREQRVTRWVTAPGGPPTGRMTPVGVGDDRV